MLATLLPIIWLTLYVSALGLVIASAVGIPLGAALALRHVPAKGLLVALIYTGMGLPPVVVGLAVYLLLSRSGPLGGLDWLFTPSAMVVAQTVIAFPMVTGLTLTAVENVDPALKVQLRSLGATPRQAMWAILGEARPGVVAAAVAGFGAVISEVGAVMLVGGNVEGRTRVLTTAIVLETRQGNFGLALALGGVLLTLAFTANLLFLRLQARR